jgi:hypothetical protein
MNPMNPMSPMSQLAPAPAPAAAEAIAHGRTPPDIAGRGRVAGSTPQGPTNCSQ